MLLPMAEGTFPPTRRPTTRPIQVHRHEPDPEWDEAGAKEHNRNKLSRTIFSPPSRAGRRIIDQPEINWARPAFL